MVACYFAYGSNMNPARVRERGMRYHAAESATLRGCALAFDKTSRQHPGVGHANVVYAPGQVVEGVLYWLAAPDEILKMDRFERAPINYSREVVEVRAEATGGPVVSWTYFANPAVRLAGLKPPRSYLAHLLAGEPFLSSAYIERLRQIECA